MAAARLRLALALFVALAATAWWTAAPGPLSVLALLAALLAAAAQIVVQTRRVAERAERRARDAAAFERLSAELPDELLEGLGAVRHASGAPRAPLRRLQALWELRDDARLAFADPDLAARATALLRAVNDYLALAATETVGDSERIHPLDPSGARESSAVAARLDAAARRIPEKHLQLREAVLERTGAGERAKV